MEKVIKEFNNNLDRAFDLIYNSSPHNLEKNKIFAKSILNKFVSDKLIEAREITKNL